LDTLNEFEQLQNEKTSLENESADLEDEQKQLKAMLKTVYDKIIQELKTKNGAKREANGELQAKLDRLQAELDKLSMPAGVLEKVGVVASEDVEEPKVANEDGESSGEESSLAVKADEEPAESINKDEYTKKHKFF
jgi:peptidoglycan hydrolase CwlO-like protein